MPELDCHPLSGSWPVILRAEHICLLLSLQSCPQGLICGHVCMTAVSTKGKWLHVFIFWAPTSPQKPSLFQIISDPPFVKVLLCDGHQTMYRQTPGASPLVTTGGGLVLLYNLMENTYIINLALDSFCPLTGEPPNLVICLPCSNSTPEGTVFSGANAR